VSRVASIGLYTPQLRTHRQIGPVNGERYAVMMVLDWKAVTLFRSPLLFVRQQMKFILILAAIVGLIVAIINFYEIIRNPLTKGWGVGLGLLAFVVFGVWAIILDI